MTVLEKIRNWLVTFPQWGEVELVIDSTAATPVSCGLFSGGMEEISRREDVLGNSTVQYRQYFTLRREAERGEDAAQWLLEFQDWVREQCWRGLAPQFGDIPRQERMRAEKGKLTNTSEIGTATYEVKLTAEYIKIFKENENG